MVELWLAGVLVGSSSDDQSKLGVVHDPKSGEPFVNDWGKPVAYSWTVAVGGGPVRPANEDARSQSNGKSSSEGASSTAEGRPCDACNAFDASADARIE